MRGSFGDSGDASVAVAHEIADLMRARLMHARMRAGEKRFDFFPIRVYELVRLHGKGSVSTTLSLSTSMNTSMDQWTIGPTGDLVRAPVQPRRYRSENIHLPDGRVELADVYQQCMDYGGDQRPWRTRLCWASAVQKGTLGSTSRVQLRSLTRLVLSCSPGGMPLLIFRDNVPTGGHFPRGLIRSGKPTG
jgi:hypothetical protein